MTLHIIFETHSTTTDNERGVATGWLPGELSAAGRAQARELGLRRRDVAAVFVSDLARAVETAEIAFAGSGIPIHRDRRLRECDYGRLNGAPAARVAAERRGRVTEPWPDGESYRDVVARVADFLREIAAEWDGERILLVGHSGTRWALDCLLAGIPLEQAIAADHAWRPGWEYQWEGP